MGSFHMGVVGVGRCETTRGIEEETIVNFYSNMADDHQSIKFCLLLLCGILIFRDFPSTETIPLPQQQEKSLSNPAPSINFEEVLAISEDGSEPIIDVRSRKELKETGKIPNSHNVPLAEIREMAFKGLSAEEFKIKYGFERPQRDEPFVLTCRSGRRARVASKILRDLGYSAIKVYDGSWNDWVAEKGPVELL